ncbi:MAG: hypothetical protein A2854_04185 [Parcubacteria group bacterium RIFCSPHIGHO2_01_FULL_56_18]|nr:MAG: hypothetical protein A2854_04185 [Parcubacteria group bacterium RIFCSPHIGHO2_01_FULL_56_18]
MSFLKTKVWPVVAGFVVASIATMIFEYINSFFFPLPKDLDWNDAEAVRAITASLPWTAYILVLLGWIVGSFKGGWVAAWLSGESKFRVSLALAILLTLAGIWNVMMLGHDIIFTVIGLPLLFGGTYRGYRAAVAKRPRMFFRGRGNGVAAPML